MINELLAIIKEIILPQCARTFRENCRMLSLMTTDYSDEAKKVGDRIEVPIMSDFNDPVNVDTNSGVSSQVIKVLTKPVVLDQWKTLQFERDDKEILEAANSLILPAAMEKAVKSIANYMNRAAIALIDSVPYHSGTVGTNPTDLDFIADMKKVMDDRVPGSEDGRKFLVNSTLENIIIKLLQKNAASESIATEALRRAYIGVLSDMDVFRESLLSAHTGGTFFASGTPAVNGVVAAGAKTMNVDGGASTGTLNVGDRFTVAGDTTQYVVTKAATATTGAISGVEFYPAAPSGFADNALITFLATHKRNVAFHPEAFAFAVRPFAEVSSDAVISEQITDPVSKVTLRLQGFYDFYKKKHLWSFDVLYGFGCIREDLAHLYLH